MIRLGRSGFGSMTLSLAILVAGCSSGERPRLPAAPTQATAPAEIEAIATLLDQGDQKAAKKRIAAALKRDPANPALMLLRDSLGGDPVELLGPGNFAYTVQAGDTIGVLAQRFLGNRLKAHQLARYNGITGAVVLNPGQLLRIPGQAPRPASAPRPERRAEPQPPSPRAKAAPPASRAATAARPSGNPQAARQARTAGLAALNQGNPARAVGLLSRAASLDPGNAAIARDLQRAQRINATVQARQ